MKTRRKKNASSRMSPSEMAGKKHKVVMQNAGEWYFGLLSVD